MVSDSSKIYSLKVIEKAIVSSDLDLTPNNDGEVIRLSIPQLTSDRRKVFSLHLISHTNYILISGRQSEILARFAIAIHIHVY